MEIGEKGERRLAEALLPLILTPLECEVIEGYLDGFSRRAIAEKLEISIADVVEIKNTAFEKIKEQFPAVLQDYERRLFDQLSKNPRRKIT